MPKQSSLSCAVVNCERPAAGSYMRAADARSDQFVVCQQHLRELKEGARPTVVAERLDLANLDGRPALLLSPPAQDDALRGTAG